MIYRPAARRLTPGNAVAVGLVVVLCGLALLVLSARLGLILALLASLMAPVLAGALILALTVRRPVATAAAFVGLVPVNRFLIMLVYHFSHSTSLTKGVELWKDALLIALVIKVVLDLLFKPNHNRRLRAMDLLVLLFLGVSLIYIFYGGPLHLDPFTRLQGFRADSEFMLAYWVGRGLHLNRRQLRLILLAIVPGCVPSAAVAVMQFIAPGPLNAFFSGLGYYQFVAFSGNTGDPVAVRFRDIPGAETLPRASSLQLGDLALAFFQLLTVSLAAALFSLSRRARERIAWGLFLAIMIATLVLTLTRSAIAGGLVSVVAIVVAARSFFPNGVLALIMGGAAAALIIAGLIKLSTLGPLTSFSDASSIGHSLAFTSSVQLLQQAPLGRGLGTGGSVGQTLVRSAAITNESWYLQIGTEMGVIGMASYALLVVAATAAGFRQFFRVQDPWLRVLCLTVGATGLAFLIVGNFLHAWE
ncbi:MAG: hypothetical protein J2P28_13915, partial [Actinobacteria bacterium]|nr:hypothetical protein [Actinomycetota bacterium]